MKAVALKHQENEIVPCRSYDQVTLQTLLDVCKTVVLSIEWSVESTDPLQTEILAAKLFVIAKQRIGLYGNYDVALITRAVRYLSHVHAVPPMDEDMQWLENMLDAVLEIARPVTDINGEARYFLQDMAQGINQSLSG